MVSCPITFFPNLKCGNGSGCWLSYFFFPTCANEPESTWAKTAISIADSVSGTASDSCATTAMFLKTTHTLRRGGEQERERASESDIYQHVRVDDSYSSPCPRPAMPLHALPALVTPPCPRNPALPALRCAARPHDRQCASRAHRSPRHAPWSAARRHGRAR